ncbi:MAG: hypothetical protein CBARDMAM_5144 [uncultured Caballeronia sp.]|nr:MAG: hypothetical protein CBARDMAM_5144 [uncultured Caballeronia sp.]
MLLDFLARFPARALVLVGDVVDLRSIVNHGVRGMDGQLLMSLLAQLEKYESVTYVVGNHDVLLESLVGSTVRNMEIVQHLDFPLGNKRFLVIHGHQVDGVARSHFPEWFVDLLYGIYYRSYRLEGLIRRWIPSFPPRSHLVNAMKLRSARWRKYRTAYVRSLCRRASEHGYDGVICGHIHWPEIMHRDDGVLYNCGDWVEHSSALIVDADDVLWQMIYDRHDGKVEVHSQSG